MQNTKFTPQGQLATTGVTFNVKAQLGRPVNPNSVRQQRLAKAPGRKTGRPINPTSVRQQRLNALAIKRANGTLQRGRPVNANSERQLRLADLAVRRAAGTLKRGRPVGTAKKANTAEKAVKPVVVVLGA